VLVCNLGDPASTNIRDHLLAGGEWAQEATFRGHPVHRRGKAHLEQVDGPTVTDEDLSDDLMATGWRIEAVWFLSKHRAASGQPSLTVHPIGNHGEARFGGRGTWGPFCDACRRTGTRMTCPTR
jgi:D-tyrosyl-tRNA(Tyr) deacylase